MRRLFVFILFMAFAVSCSRKTFTIRLEPADGDLKDTADGIAIVEEKDSRVIFKIISLNDLLKEELDSPPRPDDHKIRVPDATYVQFITENLSAKPIFFNPDKAYFKQNPDFINRRISMEEFEQNFSSSSYKIIEYDNLFSVYDKTWKDDKKKLVCLPGIPCKIPPGGKVYQILPFTLIVPRDRVISLVLEAPYILNPEEVFREKNKKKDVQTEFYLKNIR